jgi:uncharacterized membrane protein
VGSLLAFDVAAIVDPRGGRVCTLAHLEPARFSRRGCILSLIAIALLLVSGGLGGKMVFEAGVGVSGPAQGNE